MSLEIYLHDITTDFTYFYDAQMHGMLSEGVDALEGHPLIKRVTPHRKVTRTLKFTNGNYFINWKCLLMLSATEVH